MIENEQGQVAISYKQPVPQVVKVNGKVYIFDVKRAVSMAWVNKEDAGEILAITKACCGGHPNLVYRPATQSQVNVWSGKER